MTEQNDMPTKAEVQTTKLNKMPNPDKQDAEFSAEEAAEAFQEQSVANQKNENDDSGLLV